MNVSQLKQFCLRQPGAVEQRLPHPYNILVYTVGKRTFAYFKTSDPERWRFSVKVAPARFVELTDIPGVKPARWRGRYHWVTIVTVADFPAEYLRELVCGSHALAVEKLPKKRRPVSSISSQTGRP